eukprot:Em0007g1457a
MDIDQLDEERQRNFYDSVRETIICLLVALLLYLASCAIVEVFRKQHTREECYAGHDDVIVYKVSAWLCAFALCVCLGSVLLLPASIVGNEILVLYPDSYYIKWLNTSLVRGLWNTVFVGCNVSLFLLLPFAYFFMESEGLSGWKKGIRSRVYETLILLVFVTILALGFARLLSDFSGSILSPSTWLDQVPLLYSLVSMAGVVLMTVCTPLGFACIFTVLGKVIVKPKLHGFVEEEIDKLKLEEASLQRRKKLASYGSHKLYLDYGELDQSLSHLQQTRLDLERHRNSSPGRGGMAIEEHLLGQASTSSLGPIGAGIEALVILYVMCAGVIGLYYNPLFKYLLPERRATSMTKMILNCILLVLLSSAFPLQVKALGLTRLNLLGWFGSIPWLNRLWMVLLYNVLFFVSTLFILSRKVTLAVLQEVSYLLKSLAFRNSTKKSVAGSEHKHYS